ncbi:hypothetical protein VTI74DRAFT_9313 [Chaetomium olivicolor]
MLCQALPLMPRVPLVITLGHVQRELIELVRVVGQHVDPHSAQRRYRYAPHSFHSPAPPLKRRLGRFPWALSDSQLPGIAPSNSRASPSAASFQCHSITHPIQACFTIPFTAFRRAFSLCQPGSFSFYANQKSQPFFFVCCLTAPTATPRGVQQPTIW